MMHETLLSKPPTLTSLYTRALFKRPAENNQPPSIPTLAINSHINPQQLSQYKTLCGDDSSSDIIPPLYPQVLAFKLHLELLLNKQLPFPVMGLIHTSNSCEYFSPIYQTDNLNIKVGLGHYEKNTKGINCTLLTQVYVNDTLKWEAKSTYYYRTPNNALKKSRSSKNLKLIKQPQNSITWSLPANLGRQYAKITGDLNPIHLFSLSAKLFGFKQTIIHGMCMAAKATAQAQSEPLTFPICIYIEFKKPVYLPDKIAFTQTDQDFNIYPILDQDIIDSPMLSGKIETSTRLQGVNAI
ncbi:MAG: hypothetical protein ACI8SR_001239 [Oceanicoccus sp.]|jgi:hypothetical protein